MGAVCKVCGKDMMKAKGCSIAKIHVGGKVYGRIKVGDPGDFDEGRLPIPDAMTAMHCSVSSIIGDAMQSAARLADISWSAATARMSSS
mgnify:CR=1